MPTKIYLGDLAHYTIKVTNNHTPLGIGFIAAYLKKQFGDAIEITLFKNPKILISAIDKTPPAMLGLSNYVWCQSLSEAVFKYYKNKIPTGIALWGGPHFPMNEPHKALAYLKQRPYIDFYVPYEGEIPTSLIVRQLLAGPESLTQVKKTSPEFFEGAFFVGSNGELKGTNIGVQMKDINDVPSPYLLGLLDPFLRDGVNPMIETQRGCPYHCSFCHTGLDYYNRGRSFTLERMKEEILHITAHVPDPTKSHLMITDSNFGMWPQDLEFTKWLRTHYDKTGFPLSMGTSTGKGRIELVLETVKSHPKLILNNAVQSMNDTILKEIRRKNLSVAQLSHSQREIDKDGKLSAPEVILGLPLETRKSHLETLRSLLNEIGASLMFQYTLMLLPGTQLYTDEAREKYQYNNRFRLLPTAFGEYGGEKCFEIEEVAVGHKDLSYNDYLEMREVFFYWHNINSNPIFRTVIRFIQYLGDDVIDFFLYLMSQRHGLPVDSFPNNIVNAYLRDTEEELFEKPEELIKFYSDEKRYAELISGIRGKNLTHNYRALVLLHAKEWADYIMSSCRKFIEVRHASEAQVMRWEADIERHIKTLADCQFRYFSDRNNIPTENQPLTLELECDILKYFNRLMPSQMEESPQPQKVTYQYFMREDAKRYITSFPATQRLVDWALIILRMDQSYFIPIVTSLNHSAAISHDR